MNSIEKIMEQAQVFASGWATVGGRFDDGSALDEAEKSKAVLREMIAAALADARREGAEQMRAEAGHGLKVGSALYARPVPAQAVPDETRAACDVLAERRRQVSAEGYDHQHDDSHVCGEIAAAACFYAMPPGAREWDTSSTGYGDTLGDAIVPDGWVLSAGSRRRDLVKAGALILAEIERMDRAAALEAALPDCHGSSLGKSWLLAAARAIETAALAKNGLEVRRG